MSEAVPMDEFELGTPVLVCRWRLAGGGLPLENRHLRALAARTVAGRQVSTELVAWAKQHLEWNLAEGSRPHPNGVLMLVMDEQGRAAMTVGPYEPPEACDLAAVVARARTAHEEAATTGVAPEALWAVRDGVVLCGLADEAQPSGIVSLVGDLARTLRMSLERRPDLLDAAQAAPDEFDEVFLASDEHGIVVPEGHEGPVSGRFAQGYEKLLEAQRVHGQGRRH